METVSVHDLVFDRGLNPRLHGVDADVVEYYTGIFKDVLWPPILVHRGTHKLLDGWHRVEAAKRAGVYTLAVQWVEVKEEDLFAVAVKSNLAHGVRLTREERYQAIIRLMKEGWTNERIVECLGCSGAMVGKAEKADDLRVKFKVSDHPGAVLPMETLAEVVRLPQEYHDEIAELACEVEAAPADVRRTVRAIKKELVDTPQDIRRAMLDAEFVKQRQNGVPTLGEGHWLMTFASLADQLEKSDVTITPPEREAATTLFRRMRDWADRQLKRFGAPETPSMFE